MRAAPLFAPNLLGPSLAEKRSKVDPSGSADPDTTLKSCKRRPAESPALREHARAAGQPDPYGPGLRWCCSSGRVPRGLLRFKTTWRRHFRLRSRASGPEIVHFGGSKRPHPTAKPIGKGGRRSPPTFSNGFCGRKGPFSFNKSRISGPEALLRNRK